ncbi:gp322 [Bacillus phage G]|uniref:Gp322 n=1 Tax=Bacillus phage G TaxID=2884420 RepID=G3MA63_9CAUD|nr:gp322 [Bacillus phage G]AEO93581.1 gp322 [Bacillus phage G]
MEVEVLQESLFNDKNYLELIEFLNSLAIAKQLLGKELVYQILEKDNSSVLTQKIKNRFNTHGLEIVVFNNYCQFTISFYDNNYQTKGVKGNLKSERFIYTAAKHGDYVEYRFNIYGDKKHQVTRIKRLFRFFEKYVY